MKTYHKIIFNKPYRRKRIKGRTYAREYLAQNNRFICSDRFCGRTGIPWYNPMLFDDYLQDFIAFSIKQLDDKEIDNTFSIEKELPELYTVLTAMDGVVKNNRIYGINKWHTIILFKLVRQLTKPKLAGILEHTAKLIKEGYGPIRSHIMANMHYLAVTKDEAVLDGSFSLFTHVKRWYTYEELKQDPSSSKLMFFVYPVDVKHLVKDVLPKSLQITLSFPTAYNSLEKTYYNKGQGYITRSTLHIPYVNGNYKNVKKLVNKAYKLASKKDFKQLAELLPEQRYI